MKTFYYSKISKDENGIIDVVLRSVLSSTIKSLYALSIALCCLSIALYSTATSSNSIIHISFGFCFIPMLAGIVIGVILSSKSIIKYSMHLSELEKSLVELGERFIKLNHLFIESESKIIDSVHFQIQVEPEKINITLKSYGNKFADSIRKMENELSDLMGLELIDKRLGIDDVTYVFRCENVHPLSYAFENWDEIQQDTRISLDSEKSWKFDQLPHALVTGSTGSGKTYFLFHLICMFIKAHSEIIICDPKKSDLYSLKELHIAQLKAVECDIGPICKVLRETVEEMNQRYTSMQGQFGQTYRDLGLSPKIIIIDEIASLNSSASKKEQDELNNYLRQLIFQGRQAGIQIILTTQKPESEAIPTAIRDNLGLRVAFGRMSPDGYRMCFGSQEMDYRSCPPGMGYIFMNDQTMSIPQIYQAPYINPLYAVIDEIQRSSRLGDAVPQVERADDSLLDSII